MIANEDAAREVHQILAELQVPYALIGGLAVQYWGEARFTKDIDLTVIVPIEHEEAFLRALCERLPPRREDALDFAQRHRIYLAKTKNGFPVDVSLGLPGYEEEMAARAVDYTTKAGDMIRVCSAEDLIIHKAIAGRPQDLRDIEGVIIRRASSLDLEYIRNWLAVFGGWLETDDVINRFEEAWRRYGPNP